MGIVTRPVRLGGIAAENLMSVVVYRILPSQALMHTRWEKLTPRHAWMRRIGIPMRFLAMHGYLESCMNGLQNAYLLITNACCFGDAIRNGMLACILPHPVPRLAQCINAISMLFAPSVGCSSALPAVRYRKPQNKLTLDLWCALSGCSYTAPLSLPYALPRNQ